MWPFRKKEKEKKGEKKTNPDKQRWTAKEFRSCPDCGSEKFLEGPRGGGCQNIKCAGCGSKFNLMGPFGVERI